VQGQKVICIKSAKDPKICFSKNVKKMGELIVKIKLKVFKNRVCKAILIQLLNSTLFKKIFYKISCNNFHWT
jgi:hypothetical protein